MMVVWTVVDFMMRMMTWSVAVVRTVTVFRVMMMVWTMVSSMMMVV